jgi:hypothetical protein
MPKSSSILIWTVCAVVLSICKASARDLGQWEGRRSATSRVVQWADAARQSDFVMLWAGRRLLADSYEVKGDEYIAIITDTRDDRPLGRPHIDNGRRFAVPNSKIKWDRGNPTGHGIIFIGHGLEVHCYLPPGGG